MTTRRAAVIGLLTALAAAGSATAQVFTPDAPATLSVSFQVERLGGSRVLIFGTVRNASGVTYERVVLLAQGLDEAGRVVSRARAYVSGTIGPRDASSFEVRLLASGAEKRFRVEVESYQRAEF
jgi:hypothetical protein